MLKRIAAAASWVEDELTSVGVTPQVIESVGGKILFDLAAGASKEQVVQDVLTILQNVQVPS